MGLTAAVDQVANIHALVRVALYRATVPGRCTGLSTSMVLFMLARGGQHLLAHRKSYTSSRPPTKTSCDVIGTAIKRTRIEYRTGITVRLVRCQVVLHTVTTHIHNDFKYQTTKSSINIVACSNYRVDDVFR